MSLYTRIALPHTDNADGGYLRARAALEAKIEALIAMLDLLDGDCDLEPDNDGEPSLAAPEHHVGQSHWYLSCGDHQVDIELETEHDEDGGDTEPNGDETDHSHYVGEAQSKFIGDYDGSGVDLAEGMVRGMPTAKARADAYSMIQFPIVYHFTKDFRG